ncbi:MAG: hypothetical protein PHO46_06250 [Thermoguttaceae bacterium]|jgi:hypothetical protein|nr:hypothetical protein [Thermoguttaceae bacterium]
MRSQTTKTQTSQSIVDESRRRVVKRVALLACAVVLGSALITSAGCQTTRNRDDKTVDDFLKAPKPKW